MLILYLISPKNLLYMLIEPFVYILQLVDIVGPFVCMVKTHVDIVSDFSQEFVEKLTELATRHNFLIFEDRYILFQLDRQFMNEYLQFQSNHLMNL